jgi:uncharacterized protein (TIGR02246 family)
MHAPGINDRNAIMALVAALDAAASALDIDRFLELFVDGPDFAFAFNGTIRTTRAQVRAFHDAAWSNLRSVAFRTTVGHVAFPAPGIATLCATGRSERVLHAGERRSGTYALMLVIMHTPAGWRVLQCHESTATAPTSAILEESA